jgi:AraC-like DNA-binding protein
MSEANFSGRIQVKPLGALLISDVVSSTVPDDPIRIIRNASHIRKDSRDDFLLWLTLEGTATFAQDGRAAHMHPGDLVLHDQTQPFVLEFRESHRAIMVTIPRPLLISRMPTARRCVARRIAAGTPIGALAASVMGQLGRLEADTNPVVVRRIGASALDILATTMETELNGLAPRKVRQLEQVKRYLLARLDDADLDIARIAKSQNMAPRTLSRLFAVEGTTPIRWLWRQRLAGTYKALAEGHIAQVIDAALTFGFSDPSHFSRSFKAEFGQSPQAVARNQHERRKLEEF